MKPIPVYINNIYFSLQSKKIFRNSSIAFHERNAHKNNSYSIYSFRMFSTVPQRTKNVLETSKSSG